MTDLLERPEAPKLPQAALVTPIGATTLPARPPEAARIRPRKVRSLSADAFDGLGAAVASMSIALLLFGRLAAFSGLVGFVVVAYAFFLVIYAVLVALHDDRQAVIDRLATVVLYSAAAILATALAFIILYVLAKGFAPLHHTNFYTQDLSKAGSLAPLKVGGIKHAIVGTLWMITLAMIMTVPLGLFAAVFLNEVGGRFARFVRTIVEAMTALPSIVSGLFIFAAFVLVFHQKTAFAASLALSVDMLPIIIRAADVVLRLVPNNLREASAALGAPRWRTAWTVVLPTARSGLATAVILGMARGLGETAPVLLTAGYTTGLNTDPFRGPMVSLPLLAFQLVKTGIPTMEKRGFAAAALLLGLVVLLFVLARKIGGRGPGELSKGQMKRAQRASVRDANRFIRRYDNPIPVAGVSDAR